MSVAAADFSVADRRTERANGFSFRVTAGRDAGSIAEAWAELSDRAAGDNAFFHPDFVIPAVRRLNGEAVSVATVADGGGRLLAAAPFTRTRLGRIAPAVRFWGHKYAPLGTPLVASHATEAGLGALIDGLAPKSSLVIPDLPADGAIAVALLKVAERSRRPVALFDRHQRAMLRRPAGDLRLALSARRRKEMARQFRRMADAGPVTVEAVTDAEQVRVGFEEFLSLEKGGWKGRAGTALASSAETAAFAREVIANRAARSGVRIDAIRVGEQPVAVVVTFVAGATAWTWKVAYDERFAHFSPGAQLMLEAPALMFADPALTTIDSCAIANHPMIDKMWSGRLPVATFVVGPPGGGMLHRLGLAAAKAEIAARARVRQLRERLR